jgi:hypothetical protein
MATEENKEAPAEKKPAPAKKRTRKPAPWKPTEFTAKKAGGIGNKKTVAEGDQVVPASQRQEDELKKRGII